MQASNSFKQIFLKKFLSALQKSSVLWKKKSLIQRKRVIKLCSDAALASARDGATWSGAIITAISTDEKNKTLLKTIFGKEFDFVSKTCEKSLKCRRSTSKKILSKSYIVGRMRKRVPKRKLASKIARRMVKKRTQILKGIVPSGESMDFCSFLDETVDYILSVKAQIDVMQRLTNIFEQSNG